LSDRFLFETLLEFAPDQIYFKDEQSRFLKVSRVIAERFDLPTEDVIGKTDADFLVQHVAAEFRAQEKTIMAGGPAMIDVEQQVTFEDGRIRWNSTTKMPIVTADGRVVGIFGLNRDITARKQAERALQRQQERTAVVLRAQSDIAVGARSLDTALEITAQHGIDLGRADACIIALADGDAFRVAAQVGDGPPVASEALLASCLHGDEGALVTTEGGSVAAVPVKYEGAAVGVIAVASAAVAFDQADVDSLRLLSVVVSSALGREELRKSAERSKHQALHDSLTGIPNRMLFNDRLERTFHAAVRDGDRFAVMLMDLDGFKEINDTLGHAAGDRLLIEVAHRAHAALRASDTVARLGGDEFGFVLPTQADDARVVSLAERLATTVEEPIEVEGLPVSIESSIGIAFYPNHGGSIEVLLKKADAAMYAAKRGRQRVAIARPEPAESHAVSRALGGPPGPLPLPA
jgi:diguanylate cyclase (GGDEF)-like protein/PAS domain S-box-containing protein